MALSTKKEPAKIEAPVVRTASPTRVRTSGIALLLLLTLGTGFAGGWLGARSNSQSTQRASTEAQRQVVLQEGQLISSIAKDVGPSVVSIEVTSQGQQATIFGFVQPFERTGAGTGIIISEDGYVITNRHVVAAGTTAVSITLADGTKLEDVEIVGQTASNDPLDIAVLKIKDKKDKKLVAAKLGDSGKTQVGDRVIAIGNALGQFQNTVTSGIISGFGRSVQAGDASGNSSENLQDLFQTDAAINEGNSGGPLLNSSGEVIGINTAVAGGDAQNIGFAIPINNVQGIIKTVLKTGKFERPYLGIRYVTLTDDLAYFYNLPIKRGAYIAPSQNGASPIIPDSPASKAGLREKDIVIKIDGIALDETHTLASLLGSRSVGDTVELTVNRDGEDTTIKVVLEAQKQN